jgi:hypothetical protein
MVDQRPVEFSNLVNIIWSAQLGTIFAAGDGAADQSINVPTGMQVNALQDALLRCAMSLLLWDEDVNQDTIKALKDYCETGGWLVFTSCPWIGSPPKSSPAELLAPGASRASPMSEQPVRIERPLRFSNILRFPSFRSASGFACTSSRARRSAEEKVGRFLWFASRTPLSGALRCRQ